MYIRTCTSHVNHASTVYIQYNTRSFTHLHSCERRNVKQHLSLYLFFGRADEWTHGGMDCRMRPMAVIQCNAMAFDAAAEARPFVMATVCMYIIQCVAKALHYHDDSTTSFKLFKGCMHMENASLETIQQLSTCTMPAPPHAGHVYRAGVIHSGSSCSLKNCTTWSDTATPKLPKPVLWYVQSR